MPAENRGAFPKIQQHNPSEGSGPRDLLVDQCVCPCYRWSVLFYWHDLSLLDSVNDLSITTNNKIWLMIECSVMNFFSCYGFVCLRMFHSKHQCAGFVCLRMFHLFLNPIVYVWSIILSTFPEYMPNQNFIFACYHLS
jgi:hypothetical protein